MKKVFSLLITLAMLISTAVVPMSVSADASVWDGTALDYEWAGEGTEASPYLITSAAELAGLAKTISDAVSTTESTNKMPISYADYTQSDKNRSMYFAYTDRHFKLTTDIDLGNKEWTPIGRFFMRFDGVFDGDGHVVKNVYMRNEYSAMGLFGGTGSNARIVDLGVDGVDISADVTDATDYDANESTKGVNGVWGMGGLVGAMCPGGTADTPMLEGCFAKDVKIKITNKTTVNSRGTGGLFGYVEFTASSEFYVKNCYVINADLDTTAYAGALFGANKGVFNKATKVKLINCYAGGELKLTSMITNDTDSSDNLYNFGYISGRSSCEYTNSYVATEEYTKLEIGSTPYDEQYTDKAGIITAMSTLDGWSADNAVSPVNEGYPVLAWQNTWSWNGKTVDTTWAGTGTEADPYLITSPAELAGLANKAFYAVSTSTDVPVEHSENENVYNSYTGRHFKLTKDIDLGGNEWLPIGRHGMRFDGVFDGNNHVVRNLKMTTNYFGMGLFGATGSSVVIKNLGVENANITFAAKGYNGGVFDYYDGTNGNSALPNTDETWTTDALYKTDRTNGAGTLIGLFAGGTISNCYVKETKITNSGSYMSIGGLLGVASGTITSGARSVITITNAYVSGAELGGDIWRVSAFIGTLNYASSSYVPYVSLTATNCYVTDFKLSEANQLASVFTSGGNNSDLKIENTNCFADSAFSVGYNESETGVKKPHATVADKATIEKALVTGNNAWNLDSVANPINGGYPVLGWEKWWTVDTDPQAFYKGADVTVEDGNVTGVTVIQSDSAVSGTVVVAVYNGTRFESAATEVAANGTITLTTPLAVDAGDTVKVFVWNSLEDLRPLAVGYITTTDPSYSVENDVVTVEYAGILPDD